MADVTGPISTLPGARHKVPNGVMCDDHPDRPATTRIQGETDSMGSEQHDLCDECATRMQAEVAAERNTPRTCDWCKQPGLLRFTRDYDEGSSGPVYNVCRPCRTRRDEAAADELAELDREWANGFDNEFDD